MMRPVSSGTLAGRRVSHEPCGAVAKAGGGSFMARWRHILTVWVWAAALAAGPAAAFGAPGAIDFRRDVAPIFERHCVRCHEAGNPKGDLTLSRAGLAEAGSVV